MLRAMWYNHLKVLIPFGEENQNVIYFKDCYIW
jgi:hypothetical protein